MPLSAHVRGKKGLRAESVRPRTSRRLVAAAARWRPEIARQPMRVAVQHVAVRAAAVQAVADPAPTEETPAETDLAAPVLSVVRPDPLRPPLDPALQVAGSPEIALYDARGNLNLIPALRGSHEVLLRQNLMATQDGLTRIQDDEDLWRMREKKMLVAIPTNEGLRIDERLPENRRFCRPWVAQFLLAIGRAHYARFHAPLQVNSAVRTVSFQLKLIRSNGNAAQADGEAASPHLTGQAIDIAKKGLSSAEIAWMRLYLTALLDEERIDVEEEFQQACFHVSIYRKYAPAPVMQQHLATTHRTLTPALAATLE